MSSPLSSDTSPSTRRQPRCAGGRLRAHRAARRACLRAMPAQATPACAMPAKPPSSHRPNSHACHPVSATAQPACLRDALRLRDTATPRTCHPVPPCDPDSAPTVSTLRSRRAARMACHLSPPTPAADPLSRSRPLMHAPQKTTSQTLNYQASSAAGLRHSMTARSHRTLSQLTLPAPAPVPAPAPHRPLRSTQLAQKSTSPFDR